MGLTLKTDKTFPKPSGGELTAGASNSYAKITPTLQQGSITFMLDIYSSQANRDSGKSVISPYLITVPEDQKDTYFVNIPAEYVGYKVAVALAAQCYNFLAAQPPINDLTPSDWEDA